jgi:hypothetical protein
LTSDGLPPNANTVAAGIAFPVGPAAGDFFLRTDYVPSRLFRYDSKRWVKVEDAIRTDITNGAGDNKTLRATFVNDTSTIKTAVGVKPTLQSLDSILRPKADNQ